MAANRVEYHQGAIADVKSAVAWYKLRNPKVALDFIEELRRAAEIIGDAPERWPSGENDTHASCFGDFLLQLSTLDINQRSRSGPSLMPVVDRNIGRIGSSRLLSENLVRETSTGASVAVPIE